MGANKNQLIKAVTEAEAYDGPSLILAYAPCINHGINMGKTQHEEKLAVECGYWPLYRYNPQLTAEGKNPFVFESGELKGNVEDFLKGEVRYSTLVKQFPKEAEVLHKRLAEEYAARYAMYKKMAEA
jgi:pyruvate-ferredoxin/flavodoxin oxidoreductase